MRNKTNIDVGKTIIISSNHTIHIYFGKTRTIDFFDRTFHLSENNTNSKQENLAVLMTFVSMACILFVNPSIVGVVGIDKGTFFTANALSAIIGCFLMGILANYPIAIASGLGDNAF